MTRKALSASPAAERARERRRDAFYRKQEAEMYAEIGTLMTQGLSFDEAWCAIGGTIIETTLSPPGRVR